MADLSGARIKMGRRLKPDVEIDDMEVPCTLTQRQLDQATADPKNISQIDTGILDDAIDRQLVWNKVLGKQNWERLEDQRKSLQRSEPVESE